MKLHLKFDHEDFANHDAFKKAVERQLGDVYVGSESLVYYGRFVPPVTDFVGPFPRKQATDVTVKAGMFELKLAASDFSTLRDLESAVRKQLDKNVYVSRDYVALFCEYPATMRAYLRPFGTVTELEFDFESSLPDAK
jgi:hypothetical protein